MKLYVYFSHDVNIVAATNTSAETHVKDERNSGLMSSGGLGFTIGKKQQSSDAVQTSTTATGPTVASIAGNVNIEAGNRYNQVGSDVITPKGDIDITAKKVDITEARETTSSQVVEKSRQSGLTVSVGNAITNNAQSVATMASAAQNTQSSRMQALAAATSALGIYNNAADIAKAAADPIGTASVSVSVGSAKSDSSQNSTSNTAKGSNLTAGGNVHITATGAGKDSDITIQGSTVNAGGNVKLKADDAVNLQAARNQEQSQSSNSSSSASLGVSYTVQSGGLGFNIAASKGNGNGDGNSTSYTNTSVNAGNKLTIESGGDTKLIGATASGKSVVTKVGGNLTIESLQDTSTYAENQKNSGASLSLSAAGVPTGGSISAGRTDINSNYQSVGTQSGIQAGDGGFQVEVKGDTTLKGGAITSTQVAIDSNKNSFSTAGVLSLTDLQNSAAYSASSASATVGVGSGLGSSGAGVGRASGDASSTTTAGISGVAGDQAKRTGDAQTGIKPIFDSAAVKADVQAQVQITTAFGQQASKAVGDYGSKKLQEEVKLREDANKETDPTKRQTMLAEADTIHDNWKEGGPLRVLSHTLVGGLTGNLQGALGAVSTQTIVPMLGEEIAKLNMPTELKETLLQTAAIAVGGATGGSAGVAAGLNATAQNYLLHPDRTALNYAIAKLSASNSDCNLACKEAAQKEVNRLEAIDSATEAKWKEVCATNPQSPECSIQTEYKKLDLLNQNRISTQSPRPSTTALPTDNPITADCAHLDIDCIAGLPRGRQGNQYGRPDYLAIQAGALGVGASLSTNLHTGDLFYGYSANAPVTPGANLIIGNINGNSGPTSPNKGSITNEFLGGASIQVGVCMGLLCAGENSSLNGKSSVEFGVTTPSPPAPALGVGISTQLPFRLPIGKPIP